MADDDNERQADALNAMTGGGGGESEPPQPPLPPPPPRSAALFRQARPLEPGSEAIAPENDRPRTPRPARPTSVPGQSTPTNDDIAAQRLRAVTSAESDRVPIYVPPASTPMTPASSSSPVALSAERAIDRKRTFIPILLTCGVLLVVSGAALWVVGVDSAFAILSAGMSLALLGFGALLLGIAVLNMLQVRDQPPPAPR
jgi:hypothetical protein